MVNPLVIARFFNPTGAGTWYATEYYLEDQTFFGYVSIFGDWNDEWGYFSLLELEKPELGRFVIVSFVVQDEKTNRDKYDSRQTLKKLINKALIKTNWRLMSDGIHYRVGYLRGRLRCYEAESDLVKIS